MGLNLKISLMFDLVGVIVKFEFMFWETSSWDNSLFSSEEKYWSMCLVSFGRTLCGPSSGVTMNCQFTFWKLNRTSPNFLREQAYKTMQFSSGPTFLQHSSGVIVNSELIFWEVHPKIHSVLLKRVKDKCISHLVPYFHQCYHASQWSN